MREFNFGPRLKLDKSLRPEAQDDFSKLLTNGAGLSLREVLFELRVQELLGRQLKPNDSKPS